MLVVAQGGVGHEKPEDAIRDPYVLKFLGLPDGPPPEDDLQRAPVAQIEKSMIGLGRDFVSVRSDVRAPVGSGKDHAAWSSAASRCAPT